MLGACLLISLEPGYWRMEIVAFGFPVGGLVFTISKDLKVQVNLLVFRVICASLNPRFVIARLELGLLISFMAIIAEGGGYLIITGHFTINFDV